MIARDVFHGDVDGYSQMMACSGAGAVLGALVVAWRGRTPHMGRARCWSCRPLFGVLIVIGFSLSRTLWLSHLLLLLTGVALIIDDLDADVSLAQLIAPDDMRGRVMSIFMVAFRGGMPLGSLAAGSLASAPLRADRAGPERAAADGRLRLVPASRRRRARTQPATGGHRDLAIPIEPDRIDERPRDRHCPDQRRMHAIPIDRRGIINLQHLVERRLRVHQDRAMRRRQPLHHRRILLGRRRIASCLFGSM